MLGWSLIRTDELLQLKETTRRHEEDANKQKEYNRELTAIQVGLAMKLNLIQQIQDITPENALKVYDQVYDMLRINKYNQE